MAQQPARAGSHHWRTGTSKRPFCGSCVAGAGVEGVTVALAHQRMCKMAVGADPILGSGARAGKIADSKAMMGVTVTKKVAAVALLCAVVALVACRREEYRPLKLGGPVAEQPAR